MLYNNPLALCGGWEGGIEFSWHLWTSVFCFWNISHCAELGFIWRFESVGLTGLILTYYVCKILLLKAANKRPQWVGSKQQDLKMLVILLVLVIQRMCLFTTRLTVCSWTRFTRNAVRGAVEINVVFQVSDLFPWFGEAVATGMSWGWQWPVSVFASKSCLKWQLNFGPAIPYIGHGSFWTPWCASQNILELWCVQWSTSE